LHERYIRPFIQPYFYKIDNVETLIGIRLPTSANLIEYTVDSEPTYTLGGVRGVRGIFAKVQIDKETYERLLRRHAFTNDDAMTLIGYMQERYNYTFNVEGFDEIMIARRLVSLSHNFNQSFFIRSYNTTSAIIFIVLTREYDGSYHLHVFSMN